MRICSLLFPKGTTQTIKAKQSIYSLQHNSNSLDLKSSTTLMSSCRQLEVVSEEPTPQKWCFPLKEYVFATLMANGNLTTVHKVFGDGSLFSPFLFGKFFDPSDAFPLWEFESDVLLSNLRSAGQTTVDWFQTDKDYVLRAELQGLGKNNIKAYVENGKVVEISGEWKQQKDSKTKDWRNGQWWENGYVRRLELPENADWRKMEVSLHNDKLLEIKISKNSLDGNNLQGSDGAIKDLNAA